MELELTELSPVINRLKLAQDQLAADTCMCAESRDCKDIVTQLAAVSKARDRAGFAIIAESSKQCITRDDIGMSTEDLAKHFLSLAYETPG